MSFRDRAEVDGVTDVGTGFLQAVSAFGASRLGRASATTFKDTGSLMSSLADGVPDNTKPAFDQLKADIEAAKDIVKPIIDKIKKQTDLIAKMAKDSIADADIDAVHRRRGGPDRGPDRHGAAGDRRGGRDHRDRAQPRTPTASSTRRVRDQLMGIWNPWAQPFKDLADGAGKVVDSLGETVLGVDHATKELGDVLTFDREQLPARGLAGRRPAR